MYTVVSLITEVKDEKEKKGHLHNRLKDQVEDKR